MPMTREELMMTMLSHALGQVRSLFPLTIGVTIIAHTYDDEAYECVSTDHDNDRITRVLGTLHAELSSGVKRD